MFYWIQKMADWIVYDLMRLGEGSHLAEAINFFLYDSVKILLLLFMIIFLMGIVNSYFPVEKCEKLSVQK